MSDIAVFRVGDKEIIVDKKHYEDFWSKGSWSISKGFKYESNGGYLVGCVVINNIKRRGLSHRLFMNYLGVDIPEKMQVHHINNNKLDNRECNLEIVSNMENCQTKNKTIKPLYKPFWDRCNKQWRVKIILYGCRYVFTSKNYNEVITKRNIFFRENNIDIPEEEEKQKQNEIVYKKSS